MRAMGTGDFLLDERPERPLETVTAAVDEVMKAAGFVRCYYDSFERRLGGIPTKWRHSNALYVRDRKATMARIATAPLRRVLETTI